jgi:RNA polymerase sigma-70 factor, ECF subfamily
MTQELHFLNATSVELINRARTGERASIGELYERYHVHVYRYLYYLVGDIHTAEDLTSEVFLRMIRSLPNYRYQGISFQAWLFQIAHNLAVDFFRKVGNRTQVELEENLHSGDTDLDTTVERNLTSELLRRALDQLNQGQREVILLRFITGMPIAQVAQTLRKSEDTVKGLQRRGLSALRKILEEWEMVNVFGD